MTEGSIMRKLIYTLVAMMLCVHLSAQTKTFRGAWFEITYPRSFTARGSLPSYTTAGEGFDSAFFVSPDKEVEFYIFSPQWDGEATDIALKPNEKEASRQVKETKTETITYLTISAKDGSYVRSYQETFRKLGNTRWVVGIKYRNQKAYNRYKKDYLSFKVSLVQFTDGL